MKKRLGCILLCIAVLLLSACGSSADSPPPQSVFTTSAAVTFVDSLGREVTVQQPQRVAVLIGSFADIWCLAGGKDSIVAAAGDAWTEFDLGLSEDVADLGGVKSPSLETLLASEPDFVIASSNTSADVEMLDSLELADIQVAYFNVSSFQDYLNMLSICTQITGKTENYETYGQAVKQQVQKAQSRITGASPTVLYIRATASSCKVKSSQDNVLGEMLADLGCTNIADNDTSLLENLSMEAILAADPDYIFVVLQGATPDAAQEVLESAVFSNSAWQTLSAIRENRYYTMDNHLYNLKPNARWGEAYEKLADILYPNHSK